MSEGRGLDDAGRWLAAEHALGVTEGAARAAAARRAARDPAFQGAVEAWGARLAPFLDEVEPVEPPERVWRAIEREVGGDARGARAVEPWRALALLGMGAALGAGLVAAVLWEAPAPPFAAPVLVATLAPSGEAPAAVARVERGADALLIRLALPEAAARVPELWLIPQGGVPRSLGVIGDGAADGVRVPLEGLGAAPAPGDALAVSLEPPGGSPTGAPTGPVVASGPLVEL